MIRFRGWMLFLLSGIPFNLLPAQSVYEISFPNPASHYIDVSADFENVTPDSTDIKMPVWTPGSYLVREYSKNVEGFVAYNKSGAALKVVKVRKNIWRVYNGSATSITCKYQVYANELNIRCCFVDLDQAYLNGAGLYVYTEKLKNKGCKVAFRPSPKWKMISTGLRADSEDRFTRLADNYDELIDAPVELGNHVEFTFDYHGIPHHIAMIGEAGYDSVKIKNDFYKIVDEANKVFGENPNKDYTFLIHNTLSGGGGLEHHNSSSLMTARTNYKDESGYRGFLSLAGHEYFHLWLVKRLRPLELGPFDYDNEVYTRQLWFYEGFTSFYDDYFVYRAGLSTEADYLEAVRANIQSMLNTPGDKIQPVSEASYDAWIKYYRKNENSKNSTVSYYTKGNVIGLICFLDIINSTQGKQSLDSLLRFAYREYYIKQKRGITDSELQDLFTKFSGKNYDSFFSRYINGTEEIPVEEYLLMAGLNFTRVDGHQKKPGAMGTVLLLTGPKLMVTEVERDGAAYTQGLSAGDEIISIDNIAADKAQEYLGGKEPGDKILIKVNRGGLPKEISLTLGESMTKEFVLEPLKKLTDNQKLVRRAWLGK